MNEKSQWFIPERLKVGFQERQGTYTGKLAYVIYIDKKGVVRKEKSWDTWRDKTIEALAVNNDPMDGFVLNKGVGGQRQSYGWNARNEYIRVYDPRDFEFEISVANLLFILRECNCFRGKGLEGKFVYAWHGTELVLLPVVSEEYRNSTNFTSLQGKEVKAKELINGASYTTRTQEILTYVDRLSYFDVVQKKHPYRSDSEELTPAVVKRYVFWDGKAFVCMDNVKKIAVMNSDTVAPDYAELVDRYYKSPHGSKPVELYLKDYKKSKRTEKNRSYEDYWAYEKKPSVFSVCCTNYNWQRPGEMESIRETHQVLLKDNALHVDGCYREAYVPGSARQGYRNDFKWIDPTDKRLWARLESGAEYPFMNGNLQELKEDNDGEEND